MGKIGSCLGLDNCEGRGLFLSSFFIMPFLFKAIRKLIEELMLNVVYT